MPQTELLHIRITPEVKSAAKKAAKAQSRKLGDWARLLVEKAVEPFIDNKKRG